MRVLLLTLVALAGCDQQRIDCRQLIGGWHPDIQAGVAAQCRRAG